MTTKNKYDRIKLLIILIREDIFMDNEKLTNFNYGYDLENYDEIIDDITKKLSIAMNIILSTKHLFSLDDFTLYNYDEYILETNNDIYAPINIYIALDKPENRKKIETRYSKTEAPSLHYELDRFRDELYNTLINLFDETFMLTKDKYGIKISSNDYYKQFGAMGITYYIKPCIAYKNKENKEGVIYYTNNRHYIDIDYPMIAANNYLQKNAETNDLLNSYVKIFKNLYMKYYKVEDVPFEMFEVLLYNVPSELYKDISFGTAKQILEYLLDRDIKTLKTIDEQDLQFDSKFKSLSKMYATRLIKTMYKLVCNQNHKIFNK